MRADIQRLRAELQSDLAAFEARAAELDTIDLTTDDRAQLALAAVCLHHAYCAIESALVRISRALEGRLPAGPDWHQELLESMALEIEAVRPAALSASSLTPLRRLLGFRHFFRHAYAVELDRSQLADLGGKASALRSPLRQDFARLDRFLSQLATT